MRTDLHRPEFHHATLRWELDDGSGMPGNIAESTGQKMSSRLLSMKSANALLELPATGNMLTTGTSVPAILISDLSNFPPIKLPDGLVPLALHHAYTIESTGTYTPMPIASQEAKIKVAILTVSDTVSSGAGPDRRWKWLTPRDVTPEATKSVIERNTWSSICDASRESEGDTVCNALKSCCWDQRIYTSNGYHLIS